MHIFNRATCHSLVLSAPEKYVPSAFELVSPPTLFTHGNFFSTIFIVFLINQKYINKISRRLMELELIII